MSVESSGSSERFVERSVARARRALGASVAVALVSVAPAHAADPPGKASFDQYCASCHGMSATGDGPVAGQLKQKPANLRKLYEEFGTPLAKPRLREVIDGRDMPRSHGTSDMPVWGEKILASVPPSADGNEFFKRGTILSIIDYLQTLQEK